MRRFLDPAVLLSIVSLLAVAALVFMDLGRTSPGPITATHAQESSLRDGAVCRRCHGSMGESMAAACGECHAEIEEQLSGSSGFHGTLERGAGECSTCHQEHHGPDFPLTNRSSFVQAGFASREDYDHRGLGFEPQGKHAELACIDCHELAEADVLAKGEGRFLGLEESCVSCHEDPHGGRMARECADCHGQELPFAELAEFDHATFAQEGAHARVGCLDCHPKSGPHAIEALAGTEPAASERDCLDCHESPHRQGFVAAVVDASSQLRGSTCALCHDAVHESFVGGEVRCPRELHAASGFPLDGPHAELDCVTCHESVDAGAAFLERFPGRDADSCQTCHGDPHGGQFEGAGCLDCHESHTFAPSRFGLPEHARTAFPLTGRHVDLGCLECHRDPEDPSLPRAFRGLDRTCEGCHDDPHGGRFEQGPFAGEGCLACHDTHGFDRPRFGLAEHARTAFPLVASHGAVGCFECHRAPAEPESPRVFRGTSSACATCHEDVHDGSFGETACDQCHTTGRFLEVEDFDHGRWTDYPLEGPHAELDCASCHPASRPVDARGRSFGRAVGRECASCHQDPHLGQFLVAGKNDCSRCHGSSARLVFDHREDARFALDEQHRRLDCSACHLPYDVEGVGIVVRYRPLGTQCGDCHAFDGRGEGR